MIRDPQKRQVLDCSIADEFAAGKAAEHDHEGGLLADK